MAGQCRIGPKKHQCGGNPEIEVQFAVIVTQVVQREAVAVSVVLVSNRVVGVGESSESGGQFCFKIELTRTEALHQ